MRGKYAPLNRHLSNLEAREWTTTFDEIEAILGAELPYSAHTYKEWWSPNDRTHSHARAWMAAEWEPVNVNLRAETVMFRRTHGSAPRGNAPNSRPSRAIVPPSSTNEKISSPRPSHPPVIPAKAGIQGASEVRQLSSKIPNKSGIPLDIHYLMEGLSQNRPIFHSESDFQDALAEHIRKKIPCSQVRREYTFRYRDSTMRLDIWLPKEKFAIELKYPTRMLELEWGSEEYLLADHGAHPPRRYDFLKDVQRLERIVSEGDAAGGFAVLLTNHPYYWESPTRRWRTAIDADFRLHERRKVTGRLAWSEHAGAGTTRDREAPIEINGHYDLHWRDYSRLGLGNNRQFRYLAVSIENGRYKKLASRSESPQPRRSFFQTMNQWIDEYLKSFGVN